MASNTEVEAADAATATSIPSSGDQSTMSSEKQTGEAPQGDGDTTASAGVTVCGVCKTNPSKYKCPRCYLPYCSVACNKIHRENHPPDPEPEPKLEPQPQAKQSQEAPDPPDPRNPFRALDTSDRLKYLFAKYPSLPDQLLQIHAATLPPAEGPEKRGIAASVMQGGSKKHTWNHDVGIQKGKAALRKARKAGGEEGDAIREYSELILHLLNESSSQSDLAILLREQVAREDTKIIERLMAEEKR